MRKIRLLIIAVISFLSTLFARELLQRILAGTMCGIFSLQSGLCQAYLIDASHVNATLPPASVNPSYLISEYSADTTFNYLPESPKDIIAQTNKTADNQVSLTTAGGCEIIMKSPVNNQENSINEIEWVAKNKEACGNSFTTRFKPDSQQIEITESTGSYTVLKIVDDKNFLMTNVDTAKQTRIIKIQMLNKKDVNFTYVDENGKSVTSKLTLPESNERVSSLQKSSLKNQELANPYFLADAGISDKCKKFESYCKALNKISNAFSIVGSLSTLASLAIPPAAPFLLGISFTVAIADLTMFLPQLGCFIAYGGNPPLPFGALKTFKNAINPPTEVSRLMKKIREWAGRLSVSEEKFQTIENRSKFVWELWKLMKKVNYDPNDNTLTDDFRKYLGLSAPCKKEQTDRSGKPVKGTSYGDPHLITFDGYRYSFQTVGEFILAKSTDGTFEVQTRQSAVNKSLSLNSAVAMKVGNNRVAFYSKDLPDSNTNTPLRINGKPAVVQGNSLSIQGGGKIYKQSDNNYVVEWPTGEKVALTIYSRGQFQYMDVFPLVFESQANQMVGLLGNVNGDAKDDLRFRSGDVLPSKSTYGDVRQLFERVSPIKLPLGQLEKVYFDKLNKDFGNNWRVNQEESLFDYPPSKSTETFTDKAFPDAYLTLDMLSPTQLQQARTQCQNAGVEANLLEGCLFDVGFTGYSEFASRAAQVSNVLKLFESVIPGFKNPVPGILRRIPKIPGIRF